MLDTGGLWMLLALGTPFLHLEQGVPGAEVLPAILQWRKHAPPDSPKYGLRIAPSKMNLAPIIAGITWNGPLTSNPAVRPLALTEALILSLSNCQRKYPPRRTTLMLSFRRK